MPNLPSQGWLPFEPKPLGDGRPLHLLLTFAKELAELHAMAADERRFALDSARKRAIADSAQCEVATRQALVASIWLLSDLVKQGWTVRVNDALVEIRRALPTKDVAEDERLRIREQLHVSRNEQLREPAVQVFRRDMETRRLYRGHFVSIFSLMRDGVEFAAQLHELREGRVASESIIQPYLQFIRGDERCEFTGLKLADVWRYFRHTWSNPYQSIPGRSMMILVRDRATRSHPVIGIAAVSSAAVAIGPRDEAIGWTIESFLDSLRTRRQSTVMAWVERAIDVRLKRIYIVDLMRDEIVRPSELRKPRPETLARLREESVSQRLKHYRFTRGQEYKRSVVAGKRVNWKTQAKTPLFRSKRAEELAGLLSVRLALRDNGQRGKPDEIAALFATKQGGKAMTTLLRRIKAEKVGSAIAELTVCGAVPPYGEILGGKLVAMLISSPEVRLEYRRRYGKSESVIASSIAGRPIVKSAELVFVGISSLFGRRPSQYDRIAFPTGVTNESVRYEYLGKTMGVGTFQFGERTVRELELMLAQTSQGIKVNSVFGEGVNPRLRKIRGALELLGLSTDELLQHGTPRLVYGIRLARNVREYLLGVDSRPRYFLPEDNALATTERIASWWRERWLVKRAQRKEIIERVEQHSLIHPIRHGARVPAVSDPQQPGLFQEW